LNERTLNYALSEDKTVDSTNPPAIRVLLLLRLGETNAAVAHWVIDRRQMDMQLMAMDPPVLGENGQQFYDPYVELANTWAWHLYDHVVGAHMRGDVSTALATARQLNAFKTQVDGEAQRRKIPRPHDFSNQGRTNMPYIAFLERLPQLVTDLERRFQEPHPSGLTGIAALNLTDRSKRIAGLIAGMDQIQVLQLSQPGIVQPQESEIGQALIKEGEAAVEPLLECMEKDRRLTRSVGYSRAFNRDRVIISVSRAACMTLQQILNVPYNTVPEMKAYWAQNKGVKAEERWYQILQNDAAGAEQWHQAAASILQPVNETGVPGSGRYARMPLSTGQKPVFRGESLRGKQNPSVAELLVKRAEQLVVNAEKTDQSMAVAELRGAYQITMLLAQWEIKAAVAPARKGMRRAIELYGDKNTFIMSSGNDLAVYIPQWTQVRLAGGDASALAEYLSWLKTVSPGKFRSELLGILEPVWSNPKAPEVVAAGEWLFADVNSPWAQLLWSSVTVFRGSEPLQSGKSPFIGVFETGLVQVPAFRKLVLSELENREDIGWIEWQGGKQVSMEIKGLRQSRGIKLPENFQPPLRIKVRLRHCDWIVWSLALAESVPTFNPFAPETERDAAVRQARSVVERWP
jgi:hypothetical protein